jgi:Na+/H+-dicarboxylate symporter
VFNATFNNISAIIIVAVGFIGGGNRAFPEKTSGLSQATDKLCHIMLYQVHFVMNGARTLNLSGDGN